MIDHGVGELEGGATEKPGAPTSPVSAQNENDIEEYDTDNRTDQAIAQSDDDGSATNGPRSRHFPRVSNSGTPGAVFSKPGPSAPKATQSKTNNRLLQSLKLTPAASHSRGQQGEQDPPDTETGENANNAKSTKAEQMKRFGVVSPFGAEKNYREEVLQTSSVKPSAAFPAGTDTIGPHSFRKLKLLGKGGAGTVYLVVLRGTDSVYAMKELTKEDMIRRKKVMRVMTEREILATANHPFIVTMYATFQTHHRLCFVMDFCAGGEFFGVLSRQPQKRLQESAARFYAAEVLLALEYLHYLGFFYRDLKPENILMRDSGHIALTDFDLSKQAQAVSPRMVEHHRSVFERFSNIMAGKGNSKIGEFEIVDSEPVLQGNSTSFVGTLEYLAPELVKGEAQGSAVDWWTFGILIYEMLIGSTPFRAKTSEEILAKITGSERLHWDGDVGSPEARKIVKKLLKRDQKKRLGSENGATDIKNHPWFSSINFSLIRNDQPPIVPSDVPSLDDFDGVDLDRDGDSSDSSSDDEAFADFKMKKANAQAY